jgi:hypothetical protein
VVINDHLHHSRLCHHLFFLAAEMDDSTTHARDVKILTLSYASAYVFIFLLFFIFSHAVCFGERRGSLQILISRR